MAYEEAAKQVSFRLPDGLVMRVDQCMLELRETGLDVTRADVVRLLLKHALDATHCRTNLLLGRNASKHRARRRK